MQYVIIYKLALFTGGEERSRQAAISLAYASDGRSTPLGNRDSRDQHIQMVLRTVNVNMLVRKQSLLYSSSQNQLHCETARVCLPSLPTIYPAGSLSNLAHTPTLSWRFLPASGPAAVCGSCPLDRSLTLAEDPRTCLPTWHLDGDSVKVEPALMYPDT